MAGLATGIGKRAGRQMLSILLLRNFDELASMAEIDHHLLVAAWALFSLLHFITCCVGALINQHMAIAVTAGNNRRMPPFTDSACGKIGGINGIDSFHRTAIFPGRKRPDASSRCTLRFVVRMPRPGQRLWGDHIQNFHLPLADRCRYIEQQFVGTNAARR